jgi:hypothetical protein
MARLPRLIGRGRALEVLLGADDINGELAELYGYVNRSLPDTELDDFVDKFARRIASFDKQAIADTRHLVNIASLPADSEIAPEWDAFLHALGRPAPRSALRSSWTSAFTGQETLRTDWDITWGSWAAGELTRTRPLPACRSFDRAAEHTSEFGCRTKYRA